MAGELIAGKRTFIRHRGREFELPETHFAELLEHDEPTRRQISLRADGGHGVYSVVAIDETQDRVTVTVGEWQTASGPVAVVSEGKPLPEVQGYPFPS
jgi:hypothetical protein